jgi:hypothetical protein
VSPSLDELRRALAEDGFVVLHGAVDEERVTACLRRLNLAIREHGLTAEEVLACQQTTFFPHLRWEPEIWGVLPDVAAELLGWQQGDDWATPQLLLRFPDRDEEWPLEPHVDEPPDGDWVGYRGIVGVAVTAANAEDGAARVWRGSHRGPVDVEPEPVPLAAGDALVMHPRLAHAGALNHGPNVRVAVYFRLLQHQQHQ